MTTLVFALAAVHCGGGDGSNTPSPNATNPDVSQDGGTSGPHADAACVAMGTTDDPDDDGNDANCDGADGVVGVDVYVNVAAGADTNAGTPTAPLRTLGAAIVLAAKTKVRVLVASGTYPVDALTLTTEAHVFGGYAPSFVGVPKRALTTLQASATGFFIDAATNKFSMAHLKVKGDAPSHPEQPSAYGIRIKTGDVSLDDVEVQAGDGIVGHAGAIGEAGPSINGGALTCDGVAQPTYVRGVSAATRSLDGTAPGDFANKVAALTASAGNPGADGSDAPASLKIVDGVFAPSVGTKGMDDGTAGYGGAGGGLGRVASGPYAGVALWAAGGSGGAGGCPGKGGTGGTSGGNTVAVLLLGGSLHVTRSLLHTGFGGDGGDGGDGGQGRQGTPGSLPLPANNAPWFSLPSSCTSMNASSDPLEANCAAYGGTGGPGGAGGHGGGGAGGWTIAVATAAGANAQVDDATVFELGRTGSGGTGHGGGRAPSGKTVRAYAIP